MEYDVLTILEKKYDKVEGTPSYDIEYWITVYTREYKKEHIEIDNFGSEYGQVRCRDLDSEFGKEILDLLGRFFELSVCKYQDWDFHEKSSSAD